MNNELQEMLRKGVNLNQQIFIESGPFSGWKLPLLLAARLGDNKSIEILLNQPGVKVNVMGYTRQTALHVAAEAGHLETVKLLLSRGAKVSVLDSDGNTPLHLTASHQVAEVLIRSGVSVLHKNVSQQSALHYLYFWTSPPTENLRNITELLIEQGLKVDEKDEYGRTPFLYATNNSTPCVLALLISKGASINTEDRSGSSSLHFAVVHWNKERRFDTANLEFLLNQGALVDAQTNLGDTALHVAAKFGNSAAISALLSKGVQLDVQNSKGWTALHEAADRDELQVVTQLLAYGFSVNVQCKHGLTPYDVSNYTSKTLVFLTKYIYLSKLAGLQAFEGLSGLSTEEVAKANKELERAKATNISDQLCLYDIFEQSKKPRYLRYEGVVEVVESFLQSTHFLDQFPLYADILKGTFNKSKKNRYCQIWIAIRSMMCNTRKEWCRLTPDLVWENVFKCLDNKDITNVILSGL